MRNFKLLYDIILTQRPTWSTLRYKHIMQLRGMFITYVVRQFNGCNGCNLDAYSSLNAYDRKQNLMVELSSLNVSDKFQVRLT